MSGNEELELRSKETELNEREKQLNEREKQLNEREKQLIKNIDAFKQEKEVYLKDQKEFEYFMEGRETFKKEQVQKVKENLRTYEKEQKGLILETIGKQLQEQQESLNKDYGKKLEGIKECSDRLENNLKTQFDAQLEKYEQGFKAYKQQLTNILEEGAQLKLDQQLFNAQKKAFENKMKQIEEEIKKEKQDKIGRLEKEKSELDAKLDEMANENSALRQENRDLKDKIDWQENFDRERLEQNNEVLKIQREELLAINTELKNKNQELENENQELENEKYKLDPRDERIKELEKEKSELEEIRAQKEHAEAQKEVAEQNNKYLKAALNQLEEEFENLKNRYAGVEDLKKRQENIKEQIARTNPKVLGTPLRGVEELAFLERIEKGMQGFNVFYPTRLLYMFHTALKSASLSPLSVLSGVSGTGKSELPKLYAHFGGLNFLSIAVQPTWDSPESLMGYFNAIENKFDATEFLRFFIQTTLSKDEEPYGLKEAMNIVLLDEMNLAHIELYFAEFLSKLEIKRSKETNISIKLGTGLTWELPLGDNLLFVGTMNEDESTKMLSDKVLDRAFCLNFERPKTLKSKQQKSLSGNTEYLKVETFNSWINKKGDLEATIEKEYQGLTQEINEYLSACNRSIGHRVWQSMIAYMHNHPLVLHADKEDKEKALSFAYEECLVLKIFPKLRGVQTRNNQHLTKILDLLKGFGVSEDFKKAMENDFNQFVFNSAEYLTDSEYEKILKKILKK